MGWGRFVQENKSGLAIIKSAAQRTPYTVRNASFLVLTSDIDIRIVGTMEEESKRKIRDSIIGQIPDLITSLLDTIGSAATRILGDTPNSLLDPSDYLGSIRPFVSRIEESLHDLRPDIQTRFLALNVYPGKHAYFVLDVNNVDYDYETAHSNLAPIPVYVLRLSRRPKVFRQRQLDDTLAKMLAEMHNGHGYDPLPFVEDYHKTVEYRNPRSLQSRLIGTTQPTLSA